MSRRSRLFVVSAGAVVASFQLLTTPPSGRAHLAAQSRTWAGAAAGPHAVAVAARNLGSSDDEALVGRIVEWRPVRDRNRGTGMALSALARLVCGEGATAGSCFPEIPADGVGQGAHPRLSAMRDGQSMAGRHPLVLAMGSSASRGAEFVALAEALASHGLIVAEVIPPAGDAGGFDAAAVERSVARVHRVRALMTPREDVDLTRMAIVSWSFGGVPAALAGCREARAVVSLDSALRYRYGAELLRASGFDASTCTADLLAIVAGIGNAVPIDEAFVGAWPVNRVQRQMAPGLTHGDFSDRHGALPAAAGPAGAAADFARRYGAVLDDVGAFLVVRLRPPVTGAPAAR